MPALKGLVYAMAVLIVLAIALLAYGFYERVTSPDFKLFKGGGGKAPAATQTAPSEPKDAASFGEIALALPQGCSVVEMDAGERFIALRVGPAGPCARVIVFDAAAGRITGSLVERP